MIACKEAALPKRDRTRAAWLDRAGDILAGLLVALHGRHLSGTERQIGWLALDRLLNRYVEVRHAAATDIAGLERETVAKG